MKAKVFSFKLELKVFKLVEWLAQTNALNLGDATIFFLQINDFLVN